VYLDTATGRLMMELNAVDEDGHTAPIPDYEVDSLEDWELVCPG
jgi:hypothetical protein